MIREEIRKITKRNGQVVTFDSLKIENAIQRAADETGWISEEDKNFVVQQTLVKLFDEENVTVEVVQDLVEETLMEAGLLKIAKSYILYRQEQANKRKKDIFKKRVNLKPYEYPELAAYTDAIRHSYWIHTEFNYTSDIQDFRVNVNDSERNAIKNAMLAISQIEIAVKTFWGDLYKRMPKPELGSVGFTFAESEVRHHDAYSHLIEILGLNEEFEKIEEIPALMKRVNYLDKSVSKSRTGSDEEYMLSVLLFSLFIEHVSLFSQFLVMMSFNKYKNLFKGLSNAIEATSKEEELHGEFGIDLINTIRQERPEWFTKELEQQVIDACIEAYEAEEEVIDWIYESGDLDFMPKSVVKEYVKNRLNNSLASIGYNRIFEVDEDALEITLFMDDELNATKHVDFFNKRSINYTKKAKSITEDDLF